MTAALLVLLLAGEGSAVDVPRVAAMLAKLGMPVDVDKVQIELAGEYGTPMKPPKARTLSSVERRRREGERILARLMGSTSAEPIDPAAWFLPSDSSVHLRVVGVEQLSGLDGVLAHELAHAYQHQKLGLFRPRGWVSTDDEFVRLALIEGQAEAARYRCFFAARGKRPRSTDFAGFTWRAGLGAEGVLVPYAVGARYVLGLPDGADPHRDRPLTSEALLHPESRRGKKPTAAQWIEVPEAQLLLDDTWGEIGVYYAVAPWRGRTMAAKAAIGWDGDRVRAYRSNQFGDFALWFTYWDRDEDAVEFESALRGACEGSVTRSGRRVVWIGAEKVKLGETLWKRVRRLPKPPAADPREAELTSKVQERALAICRPTENLEGRRWSLGNSGASLELPAGWWVAPTWRGSVPQFAGPKRCTSSLAVDAWPAGLFENGADLEKHLRSIPLCRVVRSERLESALLVQRIFDDQRGTPIAQSEELFVFAPRMLLHVGASFPWGQAAKEDLEPVRAAMRTVRVDAD